MCTAAGWACVGNVLRLFCLTLLGLVLAPWVYAGDCTLIVPADVLADYRLFLGGRNPAAIRDFGGPHSRRDVVELVLIQQALRAGGYQQGVRMVEASSYARILRELEEGRATLSGTSVWQKDVEEAKGRLLASPPLVKEGEMMAGLYVSPDNAQALNARTPRALSSLRAVSNRDWSADWAALSQLGFRQVENVPLWDSMVRMVASQRVDVLLAPFQKGKSMTLNYADLQLVPISGVRVRLAGSRVVAVSHRHPDGAKAYMALRRGVAQLHVNGRIEQAYRQSGFFQSKTASWTILNP